MKTFLRYSLESKCEDYSDHVCLPSKLLVTQINATLNSLVYKISGTYYNLTKKTIFGGKYEHDEYRCKKS